MSVPASQAVRHIDDVPVVEPVPDVTTRHVRPDCSPGPTRPQPRQPGRVHCGVCDGSTAYPPVEVGDDLDVCLANATIRAATPAGELLSWRCVERVGEPGDPSAAPVLPPIDRPQQHPSQRSHPFDGALGPPQQQSAPAS